MLMLLMIRWCGMLKSGLVVVVEWLLSEKVVV